MSIFVLKYLLSSDFFKCLSSRFIAFLSPFFQLIVKFGSIGHFLAQRAST